MSGGRAGRGREEDDRRNRTRRPISDYVHRQGHHEVTLSGSSESPAPSKQRCSPSLFRTCQVGCILMNFACILLVLAFCVLAMAHYKRKAAEAAEFRFNLTAAYLKDQEVLAVERKESFVADVPFSINQESLCHRLTHLYFLVIVHSGPDHFVQRQVIRDTWGSVQDLGPWKMRLVFLLGRPSLGDAKTEIQGAINAESATYRDVLQADFLDSYRNLTYKHLLGYRWVTEWCPGTRFVLKTDDDVVVDVHQLFDFTSRTFGFRDVSTLACSVVPWGSHPQRGSEKWAVTHDEYPYHHYPSYCGGLAYLVTPDVIKALYDRSALVPFFWIDDVYATGILAQSLSITHFYLNLRYTLNETDLLPWLQGKVPTTSPYIFVHLDVQNPGWEELAAVIWRKMSKNIV